MKSKLKVEFYDTFSCIADQCPFSCCKGWDISVDTDTINKWNSNENLNLDLFKKLKMKKCSNRAEYYIKMESHKSCPFLNEKGLCNIVIKCGEDYLPKTCRVFPRVENSFENRNEYSLSCTCPAVVDIISRLDDKIRFINDGDENIQTEASAFKIRETMIMTMQNRNFSFKDRMLLNFHMLLFIKKEPILVNEIISQYQDEKFLLSLTDIWSGTGINKDDSFRETNELFLDIVQNYRKEKNYSIYLNDVTELAEKLNTKEVLLLWNDFKAEFAQYEMLMENCFVSKIFANCISDDIDEMIMSYQMVITEYVMIRHSASLKWLINNRKDTNNRKDRNYSDIKDDIVVYSRIIGYNTDGIKEFWEDSFDEAIWELGYMLLLIE